MFTKEGLSTVVPSLCIAESLLITHPGKTESNCAPLLTAILSLGHKIMVSVHFGRGWCGHKAWFAA